MVSMIQSNYIPILSAVAFSKYNWPSAISLVESPRCQKRIFSAATFALPAAAPGHPAIERLVLGDSHHPAVALVLFLAATGSAAARILANCGRNYGSVPILDHAINPQDVDFPKRASL